MSRTDKVSPLLVVGMKDTPLTRSAMPEEESTAKQCDDLEGAAASTTKTGRVCCFGLGSGASTSLIFYGLWFAVLSCCGLRCPAWCCNPMRVFEKTTLS